MNRFDTYLTLTLDKAGGEASQDGSDTVEAQHLLLAVAADDEPGTRRLLASVGLDHRAIREALDHEFAQSLGAAGVALATADAVGTSVARRRSPQLGASVRLAIERGVGSATSKHGPRPGHLLLGIVQARAGTVPRALALAGVDQAAFADRIREDLASEDREEQGR